MTGTPDREPRTGLPGFGVRLMRGILRCYGCRYSICSSIRSTPDAHYCAHCGTTCWAGKRDGWPSKLLSSNSGKT
jgi:hypothetical protein